MKNNSMAIILKCFVSLSILAVLFLTTFESGAEKAKKDAKKESRVQEKLPVGFEALPALEESYFRLSADKKKSKDGVYALEYLELTNKFMNRDELTKAHEAFTKAAELIAKLSKAMPDADKDGVPDDKDMCPDMPAEATSPAKEIGCPLAELGYVSVSVFSADGKPVAGVRIKDYPEKLVQVSSEGAIIATGLQGGYTLTLLAGDANKEINVNVRKGAVSYYNITLE